MKNPLIEPLEARIAPATLSVIAPPATLEGDSGEQTVNFVVTLMGTITSEVTVHFTTADGPTLPVNTAARVADNDYEATSGTLTFQPGDAQKIIPVKIFGDGKREQNERFLVRLDTPTGDAIIDQASATGTITNDDPVPTVTITDATLVEGNSGESSMVFTLTLSNPVSSSVSVLAVTADDTAVAGSDYVAVVDVPEVPPVVFAAGTTTATLTVKITGDTSFETNESFFVNLIQNSPRTTGVIVGTPQVRGTITNDDAKPTVSISGATIVEGNSGSAEAEFTVTLSATSFETISVTATAANGTATVGTDFEATTGTVTFAPSETTKTFRVPVKGDTLDELTETFLVNLSAPVNATLGTTPGTGSIVNDDIRILVDDVAIPETNANTTELTFKVRLSATSSHPVTVSYSTSDGTATTADNDYLARTLTLLTFAAGELEKTVSVVVNGDTTVEPNENFFLNLSGATDAVVARAQITGTILSDDASLQVGDMQIVEGQGGTKLAVFTVTLSTGPAGEEVRVQVETADDTAQAGSDYTAVPLTTLIFLPNETTKQVSVPILGDTTVEENERFFLNLSNPSANAVISDAQATGTILADDAALRVSDVSILEGTSGSTQATFTVTLENGPASGNVTVKVVTENGTATAGTDYGALTGTTLTFLPGQLTQTFTVPITGDTGAEANETFLVKLSDPTNAVLANDRATGTILNDDTAFTINDVSITEGDAGTLDAVFSVTLLGAPTGTYAVDVATATGTASATDFTALITTLNFTGSGTQQVRVKIIGDLIRESAETFSVLLSNPTGGATIAKGTGIGTINDNNDPVPTVSIGNGLLAEGNAGTAQMKFTVTLSQPSDSAVTVQYATRDLAGAAHPAIEGGDYSAAGATVTFAPGERSKDIFIPILGDTTNEFDETFGVTLSNPTVATLGTANGIGTIQNDEVTIAIGDVSLAEGNSGTKTFVFDVTLTTPNGQPVQNNVTVNFATADGTAISTGSTRDFNTAQGTLTFTPATGLRQSITVTVLGDARFEDDQTFLVRLLSSVNASIADGEATGTILDDDPVTVSIADPAALTEGNADSTLNFVVSLDRVSDVPITVKVNTVDGTALATVGAVKNDFTGITDRTITFVAGDTSETVPVTIIGDTADELRTETFTVKLTEAKLSDDTAVTILDDEATGTITDDDLRTLSVSDVSIVEGDAGTKVLNFTVTRSGTSSQVVSFDFATVDGTATSTGAAADFVARSGTETIAANETSKTISITISGDANLEGNERFLFNLVSSPNAKISDTAGQARGTIFNDDAGGAFLQLVAVGGDSFVEKDSGETEVAEFRVVRTGSLAQAVSVQFETVDDTTISDGDVADYVARSGTISFAAGSSTASGTIRIAINGDFNFEDDDVFQVRLFNPVNATILDGASASVIESLTDITIEDDGDAAPTLSIGDKRITEGSADHTETFAVQLLGENGQPASNERQVVTVRAATADGTDPATTATSSGANPNKRQDYSPTTQTTLTFARGETAKTLSVSVRGDAVDEIDEEFFRVLLTNAENATVTKDTATATLADDDDAPTIRLQTSTVSTPEGDSGLTNATFTLTLSNGSERPVSVKVSTVDRTAVSTGPKADFTPLTNLLVEFTGGASNNNITFNVPILNDTRDEADESFGLVLSDPQNGVLGERTGTGTIQDNDAAPVLTVGGATLSEGNTGTTEMVFSVSLSAESELTVGADFKTTDGTGANRAASTGGMADFLAASGKLSFAPGVTSQEVRVKIIGDTFREQDETFTLDLSAAVNGTITQGATSGTGTIQNDGDATLGIAIGNAFVVEGTPQILGNLGTATLTFAVELSEAPTTPTTFTAVTANGTAVRGTDFQAIADPTITIPANSKTGTVVVTVISDTFFEATESFFVGLRNVTSGAEAVTVAGTSARGTIFNDDVRRLDARTIQYIDVDGDLVTVQVSQGILPTNALGFSDPNTTVGGRQLQLINLIGNTTLQNADLTVTATRQAGFRGSPTGVRGDGFVNVGAIFAVNADSSILQFTNGIDLGKVTIDGDLGRILAGDEFVTPAIESLTVRTMGRLDPTVTQGQNGSTVSLVLGPIGTLNVAASFAGFLNVLGAQFGTIRHLNIGTLLGDDTANSGRILFSGRINEAHIGKIVGGSGANSGSLTGGDNGSSYIGSLTVDGFITGGSGANSGTVSAPLLQSVTALGLVGGAGQTSGTVAADTLQRIVVKRSVTGGAGQSSGSIVGNTSLDFVRVGGELRGGGGVLSGAIGAGGNAGVVSIFGGVFGGVGTESGRLDFDGSITRLSTGGLVGGSGANSGTIQIDANVADLNVFGSILGGSGAGSGGVQVDGRIFDGFIGGSIVGGDSAGLGALVKSGYVIAQRIQDLDVRGDLRAGANNGTGLALSGTIRSETTIGELNIRGSVIGNAGAAATIAAPGQPTLAAIQTLTIGGSARFAEILAGYDADGTAAFPRGDAVNGDARIGTVRIGGDVLSSSIVAGVNAGTDKLFGTTDDFGIAGAGATNTAGAVSRIASIVIRGSALAGTASAGIVAQHLIAVNLAGVAVPLAAGAGNDGAPGTELGMGSKIRVFEVPVV